jgi:hypothetical protein
MKTFAVLIVLTGPALAAPPVERAECVAEVVDTASLDVLLTVELPPPGAQGYHLGLDCAGGDTLEVRITRGGVERRLRIALSDVPARMRARTLALSLAEQLRMEEPAVVIEPPPVDAPEIPPAALAPVPPPPPPDVAELPAAPRFLLLPELRPPTRTVPHRPSDYGLRVARGITIAFASAASTELLAGGLLLLTGGQMPSSQNTGGLTLLCMSAFSLTGTVISFGLFMREHKKLSVAMAPTPGGGLLALGGSF